MDATMRFVIHCLDKPGALPIRLANYDAHKAYLAEGRIATVISGPLVATDGETMIGSLFVVDAASHAEVEDFNRNDPFAKAGVWESVSINAFVMRVDNRG
jgi:uncharacterized protein YciI